MSRGTPEDASLTARAPYAADPSRAVRRIAEPPSATRTEFQQVRDLMIERSKSAGAQAVADAPDLQARFDEAMTALENKANELGKIAQVKAEQYAEARDALAAARQRHHQVALDLAGVEHVQRPADVEGEKIGDVDQG